MRQHPGQVALRLKALGLDATLGLGIAHPFGGPFGETALAQRLIGQH